MARSAIAGAILLTLPGCSIAIDAVQEEINPSGTPDLENPQPYIYEYGPLTIAIDESVQVQDAGGSELRSKWVVKNTGSGQIRLSVSTNPQFSYLQPAKPARRRPVPISSFGLASCHHDEYEPYCDQTTAIAPGQKLSFFVGTRQGYGFSDVEAVNVRLRLNVHIDERRRFRRGHLDLEVEDIGVKSGAWQETRRTPSSPPSPG
jgi:hypothetical protein